MDRGAWWATVHGVAVRHDLVTKKYKKIKTYESIYVHNLKNAKLLKK